MPRRGEKDWRVEGEALPDVRRWYHHRRSRSKDSGEVNVRNLMRCMHEFGRKPAELLALDQQGLDETMQDFVEFFLAKKNPKTGQPLLGSTVSKYVDSIKSYLAYHGRQLVRPLYIPGADENPTAAGAAIPPQDQLAMFMQACDARTAVMGAMECFSGVRPQVLGRQDAKDGLVLGDFPELKLSADGAKACFTQVPALVKVRKSVSKTKKSYMTFLGPEGCDYILTYLQTRIERGERLTPKSPLITAHEGEVRFLRRGNIQDCIRLRMRQVGISSTSYIFRSYFENRCIVAEPHGMLAIYRAFFMGHTGDLQMRYGLQKEHLPPDSIEAMRTAYKAAVPFLETRKVDQAPSRKVVFTSLLEAVGYTPDQIRSAEIARKTPDELLDVARAALLGTKSTKQRQRVIAPGQLETALAEGWTVKTELRDGRLLVEGA